MLNNWIYSVNKPEVKVVSLQDKVKILLKPSNAIKLVLVQKQELENLRNDRERSTASDYINYLYNHYIINNFPKTYMCN